MTEMEKTNSVRPISLKNVIDPRLECLEFAQKEMEWGIFKGCEGQNTVQQQANSFSTSSDLSMSPSCQDKYQRYVDGVGSVRNPLSNYQNSGKDEGRGTFSF
jgi:hypothetical protein